MARSQASLFSDVRDVIQVRLNKNERVELVDTHASSDDKWYKITPPAGEFLWVYKDYVTARRAEDELADDEPADRRSRGAAPPLQDANTGGNDDEEIRLTSGRSRRAMPIGPSSVPTVLAARAAPARFGDSDDRKSFMAALSDIDLDLSAMVAEEITTWSFSDLRLRTERLMRACSDRPNSSVGKAQAICSIASMASTG